MSVEKKKLSDEIDELGDTAKAAVKAAMNKGGAVCAGHNLQGTSRQ